MGAAFLGHALIAQQEESGTKNLDELRRNREWHSNFAEVVDSHTLATHLFGSTAVAYSPVGNSMYAAMHDIGEYSCLKDWVGWGQDGYVDDEQALVQVLRARAEVSKYLVIWTLAEEPEDKTKELNLTAWVYEYEGGAFLGRFPFTAKAAGEELTRDDVRAAYDAAAEEILEK